MSFSHMTSEASTADFHPGHSEHAFSAECAKLCGYDGAGDGFPLRGLVQLRSLVTLGFQRDDFNLETPAQRGLASELHVIRISFLTLAGVGGALPWWISEKIIHNAGGEGGALHSFLDLLNRRFWELLFLKDRVGCNPQYGFCSPQHARLFGELPFAMVGLKRPLGLLRKSGGASLLHKTMQHTWATPIGAGRNETLAALLTRACGFKVEVSSHECVRLPVASRSRISLGVDGKTSGMGGVVGRRALVFAGITIRLELPHAELLDGYLPCGNALGLALLGEIATIFYTQKLPLISLFLQLPSDAGFGRLGEKRCRLRWGAALYCWAACSQVLGISSQAIGHKQYHSGIQTQ